MRSWLPAVLFLLVAPPMLAVASDLEDICTSSSLGGDVIVTSLVPGTVEISGRLRNDGTLRGYALSRYSCTTPGNCSTPLLRHRLTPDESSTPVLEMSFVDTAPPGDWTYRLRLTRNQARSCHVDSPLIAVPVVSSCLDIDLCGQVAQTFAVAPNRDDAGSYRLSWMASSERGEGSRVYYRVSRHDEASAGNGVELARVEASGACGSVTVHGLSDTPPAGIVWHYRMEVVGLRAEPLCTFTAAER